ncbi:hypothetical protein YC2023_087255 [Brassica napus]
MGKVREKEENFCYWLAHFQTVHLGFNDWNPFLGSQAAEQRERKTLESSLSKAHGEVQTNPQGEVQPTDRSSLRVFKWALKHRPISVLGNQDNCDLVSRSRWIEPETWWRLSLVSLPLDHSHPVNIVNSLATQLIITKNKRKRLWLRVAMQSKLIKCLVYRPNLRPEKNTYS